MTQLPPAIFLAPNRDGETGFTAEVSIGFAGGCALYRRECEATRGDLHETQKRGREGQLHSNPFPRSFSYVEPLSVEPSHAQTWADGEITNTPFSAALPSKEVTA